MQEKHEWKVETSFNEVTLCNDREKKKLLKKLSLVGEIDERKKKFEKYEISFTLKYPNNHLDF